MGNKIIKKLDTKQSVAIIGTGIAGMACAYFLQDKFDITIYEKNDYVGGHTNTITVHEGNEPIHIDTGFMVYNEVTYPNLTRLFKELDVATKPTSMSFSVQHLPSGLEYCGSGLNGLFAQRRNLVSASFIRLLLEIYRFNRKASKILASHRYGTYSLQKYIVEEKYRHDFLDKYLIPMSSAVWSTSPDLMLEFPASTLIQFFENHGLLGYGTQLQWRTIVDGSQSYRKKLIAKFEDNIQKNCGVEKVIHKDIGVEIISSDGNSRMFDKVIFACHADQALKLLKDPTPLEERLLGAFQYQKNMAILHTDSAVMPRTRSVWSSWNYRVEEQNGELMPSTVYYMNSLQHVSQHKDYFVSINDPDNIKDESILWESEYDHPVFSVEAIAAQKELQKLNENPNTYFCGSYFGYGFHEDALTSAIHLCEFLTGEQVWS